MTVASVIVKDLRVYIRHRKTLLLIFLAPILIMILIGSVFSGASEEGLKDIKLGIGGGTSELGEEIIKELKSSEMFNIIEVNTTDPRVIENDVRKGKYSAGIFIPGGENQTMKLYIDNSRVQIAPVISTVFLTVTEKISFELTLGFISKLWEDLAHMESELDPLKESVIQINESVTDLNKNTAEVLVSLDAIDVVSLNNSLISMKTTMDKMSRDLNQSSNDISNTRREIRELDDNISVIARDSAILSDQLGFVIDNADPRTEGLDSVIALQNSVDNVARTSGQLHDRLSRTDNQLKTMEDSINDYRLEMSNIQKNITHLESAIVTLENAKEHSKDISTQMEKLNSEIVTKTPALISDIDRTKGVLREIITESPTAIAAPVRLEKEVVFKDRLYLDFLMPAIVSIVLMFISFLLASITVVQEREKKTLVRTLMTPFSLEKFIFAKTAALNIIALMQGVILIIVAFLFYGVLIPFSQMGLLFLTILVYSASFIGIGMALATFAESENTAMLLTLVLSIPMLFLCGIFFPFETMPPLMVQLGNALPITLGIKALDSVLIYAGGFDGLVQFLAPLLVYGAAGIGLAYVLLKKEVMD